MPKIETTEVVAEAAVAAPTIETTVAAEVIPEGHVKVRITKHGNHKVSNGAELMIGHPQETFKTGDYVVLAREIAEALEKRAFAEIQED